MNPSAVHAEPAALQPAAAPPAVSGPVRFWLHVAALAVFYLLVVIAWGQRNAWPDELLICFLSVPVSVLIARQLFQSGNFSLETDRGSGHQEQLIAALVLAVGLASGQLLLMSGGLVCLGIGWLRPVQPDIDWAEWLKVPLLFLTALPFWLDFDGGRAAFATLLEDPVCNPIYRLPLAMATTQAHFLGYGGLIAMALVLHGRAFWMTLPLLPVFIAGLTLLPRLFPAWSSLHPGIRLWIPWIVGAVLMSALERITRRLDESHRPLASGHTVRRWFAERRHPPWIAVLVIGVVQAVPVRTPSPGFTEFASLAGMGILVAILCFLRSRTPRGPIHSRSTSMVAGALALTLLGEFTVNEQVRHVALGCVIIGLASWHCFWPLRVFGTAIFATACLAGIPSASPSPHIADGPLLATRLTLAAIALAALAWFASRPLPPPGARGYDAAGWVPPKRFALILLGLMLLFQLASAFWPEHEMRVSARHSEISESPETPPALEVNPADTRATVGSLMFHGSPSSLIEVAITQPRKIPYLLESPDRTLLRRGWRIIHASRFPHPRGEAAGIIATRGSQRAALLWWFEQGGHAFIHHRYARRILWTSWHLANRDLRLVTLQSMSVTEPEALAEHARENAWFTGAPSQVSP